MRAGPTRNYNLQSHQKLELFSNVYYLTQVLEGYGATETTGPLTMSVGGDLKGGHVGAPLPMAEVKLADVPEMGLVASRDNKGEVCLSPPPPPLHTMSPHSRALLSRF